MQLFLEIADVASEFVNICKFKDRANNNIANRWMVIYREFKKNWDGPLEGSYWYHLFDFLFASCTSYGIDRKFPDRLVSIWANSVDPAQIAPNT